MDKIKSFGNSALNGVHNVGQFAVDSASEGVSYISDSAKRVLHNSYDGVKKSGMIDIASKIIHCQSLDELDMTKIIVLLLAIICIIVIIFFLPKLNKSADLEKKILDSKVVKIIIACFLLYSFFEYNIDVFIGEVVITFFLFWFHHGYSAEHYGPVSTAYTGSVFTPVPDVKNVIPGISKDIETGELIVGDSVKPIVEDVEPVEHKEEPKEEPELISVDEEELDRFSGYSPNTLDNYSKQEGIFDQRDFMIMPESAPERQNTFDRICDCTKCTKPTSFVDRRLF